MVLEYKTQLNNSNSTGKTRRELRPALVFLSGDLIAVPIPLEREEVILGRALEADVRINDAQVSRLHAKINRVYDAEKNEIAYRLKDLGSKNGTLINGQPIVEEFLQNGDKIEIGGILLRFELVDEIDQEYQRQIHRLLSHDELTGLLTSRSFFSELRREAARARLENRPFCVLMMDIDHFKSVNDTYGHLTGSKTLEEVGFCITRALRTGDVASRFGGEEFAAFLLDAELKQGIVAAERVRTLIEKHPFTVTRQSSDIPNTHSITISIGVASFPDDGLDPIELIEKADSALYRAKRDGRNCVRTHRELTPEELAMPFPVRTDFESTGNF